MLFFRGERAAHFPEFFSFIAYDACVKSFAIEVFVVVYTTILRHVINFSFLIITPPQILTSVQYAPLSIITHVSSTSFNSVTSQSGDGPVSFPD